MEYDLISFTNRLIELFVSSKQMPNMNGVYVNKYGHSQKDSTKHKNRPQPRDLKSQITNCMISTKTGTENMRTFDIGNEQMERDFPYYHILQQAPVIHKKDKGTTQSKGSQMFEKDVSKRDYELVHWNGKTFTKEYQKNVRGKRLNLDKVTRREGNTFYNVESKQYLNVHYRYIDRICDEIVPVIASEFGMKTSRKKDSGLIDEFAEQQGISIAEVLEIFESFM